MQTASPNLDLLRALAVTFVVLSHMPPYLGMQAWDGYSTRALGHVGVAAFFVHTMLVLLQSLQRSGDTAAQFFIRRFFRIYPLSVTVVLLVAGLKLAGGVPFAVGDLVSNLLLVQNLTGAKSTPDPLWTLCLEMEMYLVVPLLFVVASGKDARYRMALLLVGSVVVATAAGAWRTMTLVSFVPCFLAGALAFVLGQRAKASPAWLLLILLGGAVTVPILVAAGAPETPLLWVLCLALGMVIPRCRRLTSVPVACVSKTVAKFSYGIYLTHVFAFSLAFSSPGAATMSQWVLFLFLLPGLAVLAYRAIEAPGIALGRRLSIGLHRRRAAVRSERLGLNKQSIDLPLAQPDS